MKQTKGTEELWLTSCPSLCWAQGFVFWLQIFIYFSVKKREKIFLIFIQTGGKMEEEAQEIVSKHMNTQFNNLHIHGVLGPSFLCRRYQAEEFWRKEGRFNRDPVIQNRRDSICNNCIAKCSIILKLPKQNAKCCKVKNHYVGGFAAGFLFVYLFFNGKITFLKCIKANGFHGKFCFVERMLVIQNICLPLKPQWCSALEIARAVWKGQNCKWPHICKL